MVGQPGLPGAVVEHLSPDVIELRVVDADDGPHIGQEALAGVDAAVGSDPGELPDILVGIFTEVSIFYPNGSLKS